MPNQKLYQFVFLLFGLALTGVGIIGAFLPLLPSTIFFILAAACFSRSSPRFERWLVNHPVFGPPIQSWRNYGAISRSAKAIASISMIVGFCLFYGLSKPGIWVTGAVAAFILAGLFYVNTRPAPPNPQEE